MLFASGALLVSLMLAALVPMAHAGAVLGEKKPILPNRDGYKMLCNLPATLPAGTPARVIRSSRPLSKTSNPLALITLEGCSVLSLHCHALGSEQLFSIKDPNGLALALDARDLLEHAGAARPRVKALLKLIKKFTVGVYVPSDSAASGREVAALLKAIPGLGSVRSSIVMLPNNDYTSNGRKPSAHNDFDVNCVLILDSLDKRVQTEKGNHMVMPSWRGANCLAAGPSKLRLEGIVEALVGHRPRLALEGGILQCREATVKSPLHQDIQDYARTCNPEDSMKHMAAAVRAFQDAAQEVNPDAKAEAFGSRPIGLSGPGSDTDIAIVLPAGEAPTREDQLSHLEALRSRLYQRGLIQPYEPGSRAEDSEVVHAKVPILKAKIKLTSLGITSPATMDIDVTWGLRSGLKPMALMRRLLWLLPELRPLVLVLKGFLDAAGMNDTRSGGLSSYNIFWILVAHLQSLPEFSDVIRAILADTQAAHAVDQLSYQEFVQHLCNGPRIEHNLGVLLLGCLERLATLDRRAVGISVREGGFVEFSKLSVPGRRPEEDWALYLQDPEDPSRNMALSCYRWGLVQIVMEVGHGLLSKRLHPDVLSYLPAGLSYLPGELSPLWQPASTAADLGKIIMECHEIQQSLYRTEFQRQQGAQPTGAQAKFRPLTVDGLVATCKTRIGAQVRNPLEQTQWPSQPLSILFKPQQQKQRSGVWVTSNIMQCSHPLQLSGTLYVLTCLAYVAFSVIATTLFTIGWRLWSRRDRCDPTAAAAYQPLAASLQQGGAISGCRAVAVIV